MDAQNDISAWVSSIPKITKYWFFSFFLVPLTTRLGLISPFSLLLFSDAVFYNFQIWRLVTCLLWYKVNFHWLMLLYFLYSYSQRLETGYFAGAPADYVFMLLFNALCLLAMGLFMGFPILSSALVFSVVYVWCQINKDIIVNFWFGVQVKAMYFPWVLFFFFFILGADWASMLMGIVVGHLYFFLTMKYPQEYGGRRFISTPQILYKWLPNDAHRQSGFGVPPARRRVPGGDGEGRHQWGGAGQRLGGE